MARRVLYDAAEYEQLVKALLGKPIPPQISAYESRFRAFGHFFQKHHFHRYVTFFRYGVDLDGNLRDLCHHVDILPTSSMYVEILAASGDSVITTSASVASLVLNTFVGPYPRGYKIIHLNGDRNDCSLRNLAYFPTYEKERARARSGSNTCPVCDGTGSLLAEPCSLCQASGKVEDRALRAKYSRG